MTSQLKSIEEYELDLGKFQSQEDDQGDEGFTCRSWIFENGEVLTYYKDGQIDPVEVRVYHNT